RDLSRPNPCPQAGCDSAPIAQQPAYLRGIALPDSSQLHADRQTIEQFRAHEGFQLANLPTDGALGEAELQTCARGTPEPSRTVENYQRVERRHGLTTDCQSLFLPFLRRHASFYGLGFLYRVLVSQVPPMDYLVTDFL